MKRMIEGLGTWIRGLVWTAMVLGCAWAGAQSYDAAGAQYRASVARYNGLVAHYAAREAAVSSAEPASGPAQNNEAPVKDDLFTGIEGLAKNATHVTEITMDPDS